MKTIRPLSSLWRVLALTLAAALALAGCGGSAGKEPSQPELALPEPIPIEVEHDLPWWWEHYLADMVYLIQQDFPQGWGLGDQEICLEYVITKAGRDGQLVSPAEGKGGDSLITPEQFADYAKRYFGRTSLEGLPLERMKEAHGGNLGLYAAALLRTPEPDSAEDWAFRLTEAKNLGDGRVAVTVVRKADDAPEGHDLYRVFTFAHNGDDSYRLERVVTHYTSSQPQPVFSGAHTLGDWQGPSLERPSTALLGRASEQYLWAEYSLTFGAVQVHAADARTLAPVSSRTIPFEEGEALSGSRVTDDRLILLTNQRILLLDEELTMAEELPLPALGWDCDLSPDLNRFAYTDRRGLVLRDLTTGQEEVLTPHPRYTESEDYREQMGDLIYRYPTFSEDGRHLTATQYGYEHLAGFFVYSLSTGEGLHLGAEGGDWSGQPIGPIGDTLLLSGRGLSVPGGSAPCALHLPTGRVVPLNGSLLDNGYPTPLTALGDSIFLAMEDHGRSGQSQLSILSVNTATGELQTLDFQALDAHLQYLFTQDGAAVFAYCRSQGSNTLGVVRVPLS